MEHSEAVGKMAAERFLLDELTPEEREAFEEHLFDCPECAMDLRAGVAFVDEAKAELPTLIQTSPASPIIREEKRREKLNFWHSWFRPAFAAPAFAALLLVLGYQNLITFPALRSMANQPRLLPSVPLRGAMRGGAHLSVTTDREHGLALPISLSQLAEPAAYSSYSFDLLDTQDKLVWTGVVAAPSGVETTGQQLSLVIPGAILRNGAFTIAISGTGPNGEHTEVTRYVIDLHLTD